jgi:hypothetical protein
MHRFLAGVLIVAVGLLGAGPLQAGKPDPLADGWKPHIYHLNRALNYRALLDAYAHLCPALQRPAAPDLGFIDMLTEDRMRVTLAYLDAEEVLRQRVFHEQGRERATEDLAELGGCGSRRIPTHLARIAQKLNEELAAFGKLPILTARELRFGLGIEPQR